MLVSLCKLQRIRRRQRWLLTFVIHGRRFLLTATTRALVSLARLRREFRIEHGFSLPRVSERHWADQVQDALDAREAA